MWSAPPDTEKKNQPTTGYFSDQAVSRKISPFVTPDSFLHAPLYQAADWPMAFFYNWLQSYAWIYCYSTLKVANWQKPPPTHTLFWPHRPLRDEISKKHA